MVDASKNFLTTNTSLLERLQDDDLVYGYNYNRIVDALTGNYIGYTYTTHNDTWVNVENVDPNFPGRLYYVIPKNTITILDAVLSFKLLSSRTSNAFTVSGTGFDATGESGHTHNHNHGGHGHSIHVLGASGQVATLVGNGGGAGWGDNSQGSNYDTSQIVNSTTPNNDATASSGHSHNHSHTIDGSSFLGISEGTVAAGVTIQFDGTDQTVALGGPWNSDIVEMSILKYLPQSQGVWHVVNLTSTQLGQMQTHLRLVVLVSSPK